MTQTHILLLILSIIPFLNCASTLGFFGFSKPFKLSSRITPILFFIVLFSLHQTLLDDRSSFVFLALSTDISLAFGVDKNSLNYLFLFNLIWVIFAFYSDRFLKIKKVSDVKSFNIFAALAIAITNLMIISDNFLTILFFYYFLMILRYFFASKFFFKKGDKTSILSLTIVCLEPILLFIAIFLTYHLLGDFDFSKTVISSTSASLSQYIIIFSLYFIGLFLSFLAPLYLLKRDIKCDPVITYALFFLSAALSSFYIFTKLLGTIFKVDEASVLELKNYFIYFEYAFLLIIIPLSVLLILSKGIKSSFIYLVFHQVIMSLFVIITFFTYQPHLIFTSLVSSYLSITLLFLCLSNLVIYLSHSENKDLKGLFYNFKITISCLLFALLSLIGLVPGVSAIVNFHLIKIILEEGLLISGLVLIINIISILILAWKILYPLFLKSYQEERLDVDIELAKNIDRDSSLISTILVTTLAMILLIIPFFNTFL